MLKKEGIRNIEYMRTKYERCKLKEEENRKKEEEEEDKL